MDPQKAKAWAPPEDVGVIQLGKTRVVPEAVIDKMQASPTPGSVKERRGFVGTCGRGDFYSSPGTVPPSPRLAGRERAHEGLGQSSSTSGKARTPVKPWRALGISGAGPPSGLDVTATAEGLGRALWLQHGRGECP